MVTWSAKDIKKKLRHVDMWLPPLETFDNVKGCFSKRGKEVCREQCQKNPSYSLVAMVIHSKEIRGPAPVLY